MLSLRQRLFETWFATAGPGDAFAYHRGELAIDRVADPSLGALADRVLGLAEVEADIVSKCGHIRSHLSGTGHLRVVTRRQQGETVYLAVRTKAPIGPV